ncbi:hypothetical protein [Synoicihabitans lomoniglobus]|uniref:Uncharacterized protein n=1 Tax=Synoicihabitans lomoniglobus TaxID=2909285 RepID=A0AAE9ZXZ9_9BACT|nr:hypothetical protein [Opitutaceae bacterium LMO-M01]WED65050.1 hypothetical protein PXH66_22095 [Opitutaceae bacterium LMO-M01]
MDENQFRTYCHLLQLPPDANATDLERAWMRQSVALTRADDPELKARTRAAYDALRPVMAARDQLRAKQEAAAARVRRADREESELAAAYLAGEITGASRWDPRSMTSPWVNALALPVVIALAWGINHTPVAFFLQAFKIWIHEFGHATVAWMAGFKALPLPIGWTNISPAREDFVYWGILFLLGVFFVAGWRERRLAPLLMAPVIAGVQWWMTWRVPDWQVEQWIDFGGVGGEFYLSALMMAAFFLNLPEKFRWGTCRYLFLFFGAAGFLDIYTTWIQIQNGHEQIPWGSMMHGDDDEGGDMNKLHYGWDWPIHIIIRRYVGLGHACVVGVAAVYLFFNLRLHQLIPWLIGAGQRDDEDDETG